MSKIKKDLTKDFELATLQAIKNHNDSVLQTNMALQDLRRDFDSIKATVDAHHAEVHSRFVMLDISLETHRSTISEIVDMMNRRITDYEASMSEFRKKMEVSFAHTEQESLSVESFNQQWGFVLESLAEMRRKIDYDKDSLGQEIQRSVNIFRSNIDQLRSDVFDRPSEAEAVRQQLTGKLQEAIIDSAGLVREVDVCKKTTFTIEKHIEDLYTQVERLRGSLSHKQV